MKNIRLFIIASSLMLCLWLTAAFTAQTQPTSPLNSSSQSAETTEPSIKAIDAHQEEIAEPVVQLK